MSVAQATVTHTVSQVPVRPQYGFPEPSLNMVVGNVLYLLVGGKGMERIAGRKDRLNYFKATQHTSPK